ncbi:uncharacterized protein K452DRAFT_259072 [Aplosporella prunicola CBS 121167]|uniref:Uncharacterized protein n=1 Tax=Aplosporella prunicola CBS 121167 TaxID=1176127 RepID=A0A6A6AX12_9PEZI|nr:uncharacterized protein K452DRAFT_259072 [Aplosporella prunicola CBS 121167]KAF2136469.1 hypothetical protein K452DRAFT_259072 [Aplosporella prunicola CBS 121167]
MVNAALGQTITVVNKSGKVVSTSKHLVNVFKEAKSAYRERKAEIKAVRDAEIEEKRAQRALEDFHIDDDDTKSRRSHKSRSRRSIAPLKRGYTDSWMADEQAGKPVESPIREEANDAHRNQLVRRYTEGPMSLFSKKKSKEDDIDMDLAYGELPPPMPEQRSDEEQELRDKMNSLTRILDEAQCVHYSVTTMIDSLQKNPDALAAVALTLAEISNLVAKMGPGVLSVLKVSFPAVVALLASPTFMIAAGVGVGVTIVALGGYKIIKKMTETPAEPALPAGGEVKAIEQVQEEEPVLDELQPPELSRIERWRRGIADVAADSIGTSVDGELVTPEAAQYYIKEGVLKEDDLKSRRSSRIKRSKSVASGKTQKTHRTSKTEKSQKPEKTEKAKKKKEPSGIRMLFSTH